MASATLKALTRALAHDVGKYIARTARNVAAGSWTTELAVMLLDDLFDEHGERALQAFMRLSSGAEHALAQFPEWTTAHDALVMLDGMESELRKGDRVSMDQAARLALTVEAALRALWQRAEGKDMAGGTRP